MTRVRMVSAETFRSLGIRNFRLFFVSQVISLTGTWLQLIAQTLLVLRLTDSGAALGLLTVFQFGPILVLGAWAGLVIDRVDKRRLLAVTQAVMAAAALVLGVLVLTDAITVPLVYALALVTGMGNTFDNPARRVLVNELVPLTEVANAVSLNSTVVNVARLIGPAMAGLLVTGVGIGWCFVLNGLSYAAPFIALRRMDPGELRTAPPVPRGRGQLREGFRYAWSIDELRLPLLLMAVVGTLAFNFQVLFPLFAQRDLAGGEASYTVLTSIFGIGSLAGSLWLARRGRFDNRALGRSSLVLGASTLALAAAPNLVLAAPVAVVVGFSSIAVLSGANTVLQLAVAPEMRGRVLALFTLVFLGSTPIGGPIAGWLAEAAGARAGLALGAVAAVAGGIGVLGWLRQRARGNEGSPCRPAGAGPSLVPPMLSVGDPSPGCSAPR